VSCAPSGVPFGFLKLARLDTDCQAIPQTPVKNSGGIMRVFSPAISTIMRASCEEIGDSSV